MMQFFPFKPMDADGFAEALEAAKRGEVLTDQGATDEVDDALFAVAQSSPNPPARLIDAATAAFIAANYPD